MSGEVTWDPRWESALTLAEHGELVADWLEGRAEATPFYPAPPDPETVPLVPVLAELNRSGFVTEFSQPGEADGDWAQRAAVSGYCEQDVAERVASISVREDLIVVSQPAGLDAPFELPISRTRQHYTFTILCGSRAPEEHWPRAMRAALLDTWYVSVCDPVWGRNDMLWPMLTAAMNVSVDDARGSLLGE